MRRAVWLAVNGLRWLTVAAFIAWANPMPLHWSTTAPALPATVERSIQSSPCAPWAQDLGRWSEDYVCAVQAGAEARYARQLRQS